MSRTIIGSPLHTSILVQVAKSQLNTALENLRSLQNAQSQSFQRITADEQISAILEVSIVRNQIDPRLFDVNIKAATKGLKNITTAFRISTI